jgi:starch synthase
MLKYKYKDKLKVLNIVSELTPIVKMGGLGDVTGFLPGAIAEEFHIDTRIFLPKFKYIDLEQYPASLIMKDIKIRISHDRWEKVSIWKTVVPGTIVPVYLVENNRYFPGDTFYDQKIKNMPQQTPFYFLSKVALEIIKAFDWPPDIIHCHDGMIGMVPKWLRTIYSKDPFYKNIATVFTIHNLKYQPLVEKENLRWLGLKKKDFREIQKRLHTSKFNIMAEAINNADAINTVSPTYAKEILTKKYGAGLHTLLREKKNKFTGILNGIDYQNFDPRYNDDTPVKYWIDNLDKKVENKLILQKKFGLTQSADLPLICVVSRLVSQKGLDLIEDVLKDLVDMGAQFVILGSGSEKIEKIFVKAEKKYPKAIEAEMEFDAHFAQTIYAGADMILMPSRFEPCGLSQIIAMRFGTIPIVRKTGGLADTVRDGYTGFVFNDYDKNAFLWAIRRAVDIYYNQKENWRKMQIRAMKKDFSWKASAKKYIWLYKKAVRNHKAWLKEQEESNENKT